MSKLALLLMLCLEGMLLSGLLVSPAWAVKSAPSTSISANPSISHFRETGEPSTSQVEVWNIGTNSLTLGGLSVSGQHAAQFSITADACSNQTLLANASCMVDVTFTPGTAGHKQALLDVPSGSADTPLLQTFLASYEDAGHEASRRLPPVLYSLSIPENMVSGQTYTLEWSLLGYHDGYLTTLAMFNCTGVTNNNCGASFSDANRFLTTGAIAAESSTITGWYYGDVYAREYKFSMQFTPDFSEQTDIVMRFYQKSTDDAGAGLGSLSLVIPGNLSGSYYDKEGRRLLKTILPK